ncbi:MAG: hypothetical protein AAF602_00055 [Myxococcota bacterium]
MTTSELPLLRNCAISWPIAVGVALLWGIDHAVAAGISGAVVVANLWLLSVLSSKLVEGIAREDPRTALWMAALFAKFALFAGLLLLVGRSFPLLGVAFGFLPLLLGTLLTGIEIAVKEPADFDTAGEGSVEPAPPTDEA